MNKILLIPLLLAFSTQLLAQSKFEKESRIKHKDVPARAQQFINSVNPSSKVKWYKEEGLLTNSFEAKFKLKKAKWSIEFDTLGNVEDVEIEINWKSLESKIKDSILSYLHTECSRIKVQKIQSQFLGNEKELLHLSKSIVGNNNLEMNYEIIIRCKYQNKVDLFEYLFDKNGKFISKSILIFKNSSHLEY